MSKIRNKIELSLHREQTWDENGDWIYAGVTLKEYLTYIQNDSPNPTGRAKAIVVSTLSPSAYKMFNRIIDCIIHKRLTPNEQ